MNTLKKIAGPDYPSWARTVPTDPAERNGAMNVGALRSATASASAVAPFDVEVQLADGQVVTAAVVACQVQPTRLVVRVRLPMVAIPKAE